MFNKRKSKKRRLLLEGLINIDITASGFDPIRTRDSNIIVSWENVGRYFKDGFSKAINESSEKELIP